MSTKIKVSKLEIVGFRRCFWRSSAAVEIDQMCLHVGGGTGETVEEGAESSWSRETPDGTDRQRHTLEALRGPAMCGLCGARSNFPES